jgi:hypothetical protein
MHDTFMTCGTDAALMDQVPQILAHQVYEHLVKEALDHGTASFADHRSKDRAMLIDV